MVFADMGGMLANAGQALADAGVADDDAQQILTMLAEAETLVSSSQREVKPVPAASFGGAPTATTLQAHTSAAHGHIIEGITQMTRGLRSYEASARGFVRDAHDTDDRNAGDIISVSRRLNQIDAGTACTSAQDFSPNGSCQVED